MQLAIGSTERWGGGGLSRIKEGSSAVDAVEKVRGTYLLDIFIFIGGHLLPLMLYYILGFIPLYVVSK